MNIWPASPKLDQPLPRGAFSAPDLLVTLAVLSLVSAVAVPLAAKARASSRLAVCQGNMGQISKAVLQNAADHDQRLPRMEGAAAPGPWWTYTDQLRGILGLSGPASSADKVLACPEDRGYDEGAEQPTPFCQSKKHNYTSYVFNGVNLPSMPNVADRELASIKDPARTLLVMEWVAHAPLSWHRSRTGRANTPFYNDAECVVGFVDGHAALLPIHYDGLNAAYTRDPAPGYGYKYSAD